MNQMFDEMKTIRNDIKMLLRKSDRLEDNICHLEDTFKTFETRYQEVLEENEMHLTGLKIKTKGRMEFQCDNCTNIFDTKWKFQAHRKYPCVYECSLCDRNFGTQTSLQQHIACNHKMICAL